MAEEANIDKAQFKVSGEDLDSHFEIQFTGDSAAALAKQFLSSLQLGRGVWKPQVCQGVGGDVQVFVNPEKNPAQVKKEILTKKLQKFLGSLISEEVSCSRVLGRCFVKRRRIVSVLIKDESDFILDWDKAQCNILKLEWGIAEAQFRADEGGLSS